MGGQHRGQPLFHPPNMPGDTNQTHPGCLERATALTVHCVCVCVLLTDRAVWARVYFLCERLLSGRRETTHSCPLPRHQLWPLVTHALPVASPPPLANSRTVLGTGPVPAAFPRFYAGSAANRPSPKWSRDPVTLASASRPHATFTRPRQTYVMDNWRPRLLLAPPPPAPLAWSCGRGLLVWPSTL